MPGHTASVSANSDSRVASWLFHRFQPYKLMPNKLFWPLVIVSTPAAFVGGLWKIDALSYHLLVGVLMALAALRMIISAKPVEKVVLPAQWLLQTVGLLLGLSAGLTGIGGGVFLSPLLLIFGWCRVRQSTAVYSS